MIDSNNSSKEIDSLKNIKSQILYRDILNNIDLRLDVIKQQLKISDQFRFTKGFVKE